MNRQYRHEQESVKEKEFDPKLHICANCIYFSKFPIQKKTINLLGSCHCNPPQAVMPDPYETEENQKTKLGVFPLVLGDWSCGMFFDRNEKKGDTQL